MEHWGISTRYVYKRVGVDFWKVVTFGSGHRREQSRQKKKAIFVTLASPMLPYFSQSGDPRKPTSVWGSCLSRGTSLGFDHQLFRLPMAIEWGIPRWTSPMLWLFLLSELTRGRNHRQWTWLGYLSLSLRRTTQDILPRNRERTDLDGKTSMISCKKKLNSILIGG